MVDTRTEQGSRVPAIVAAVLLAATIALVVVLFTVIRPDKNDNASANPTATSSTDVPQGGLAPAQQRVVDAATIEIKNIFTYARKTFDADYQRALSGATGDLAADLKSKMATLLSQMTDGKFDLDGAIIGSAFEQIQGDQAVVLVSAQGYKLPDGAQRELASAARFEVTLLKVGDKWLASGLTSVGLQ